MTVQEKLAERFGIDEVNYLSCVYIDDGENSMRELLKRYGPFEHAIEIGTYRGVSTAILSEYCGQIDCIDIVDQPERKSYWDYLGVNNAKYHLAKSNDDKKEIVRKLINRGDIDLVFVDGDHSYQSARADIDLCHNVPYILVHDYSQSHFPGVVRSVDETSGRKDIVNLFAMIEGAEIG